MHGYISHSFKTLLSLLGFLTSQFQNFTNLSQWNFFGLVSNPTYSFIYLFIEICRNYMSITITIVSNITVLVSHNIIFCGFFMPMSHGFNKKTTSSAFQHLHPPYQVFNRFVCFTRNALSIFFCCDQIICGR